MNQKQLERIIASALARRFSHKVSDESKEKLNEAQRRLFDAQGEYRIAVEAAVDEALAKY